MPTNLNEEFNLTNADALFKIDFRSYYDNVFNSATPTLSQITKTNDFYGKKLEFPVPTGYHAGVGSGTLPESQPAPYGDVQILSKKVYATAEVDREAIMASMTTTGAFVEAIKETVKKVVESDMWNHSRILFGNGDGSLGTIDSGGVTDNGSGNYSLVISSATWKEANWEEGMFINVSTGTDLFEIISVTVSTRTVVIQRQAGGTNVPAATNVVYLQGSKDNDPFGLKQVTDATSSTLYNVSVGRKWMSYQEDASTGISTDLLNKVVANVERRVGVPPNLGVTSYVQWEKLLNLLEDQKRYNLTTMDPKAKNLKGIVSFNGIEFMSSRGAIKIFPDKFCDDDRFYFLNSDHIKYFRRPQSGWVKEDVGGAYGYLRAADEDKFQMRFATYGQNFIVPTFQSRIKGLTT